MSNDLRSTYDILERIGEGSGGIVYKAYHKRLRKTVVLKKIIDPGKKLQQGRQEVDVLKNVNHTYLPQVLDFLETDEGVFTVMNYIPGKSFQRLLNEGARFRKEDLLKWALQICSALNYLHTRDIPIIHGDIKPSNIMLKPDGDICLIDFNISFFLDENTVLGCTKGYTSPEQFWAVSSKQKQKDLRFIIDEKADIYSVGATLYHLATGNMRADYSHEVDVQKMTAIVGHRFAQVIAKATDLDPKKRFDSAAEMYHALQAVPEESSADLKTETKSRWKAVAAVAIAVLVMGAGAGGYIAYSKHQDEKYNGLVAEMKSDVINGKYRDVETKFKEATDIHDDNAEAYYWNDYAYYCRGDYAGCATLAADQIANKDIKEETEKSVDRDDHKSLADLYCLMGTSQLENDDTEGSLQTFGEVEDEYPDLMRSDNYRDYAVALARNNQLSEAREMLDRATKMDDPLPEYSTSFTEGEIYRMSGDDEEAARSFSKVIEELRGANFGATEADADKELMLYRSYMEESRIYKGNGDYSGAIDVLKDAAGTLGTNRQPVIVREMAANYSNREQYGNAADCYRQAAESEGAIDTDWYNYAIMELKRGSLTGSGREAIQAANNARYGADEYKAINGEEDFGYWAIEAYAEAIEQRHANRPDYDEFDYYYSMAVKTYPGGGRFSEMMNILDEMEADKIRKGYR